MTDRPPSAPASRIRAPRRRWRSMETLVDAARRILFRHRAPALPLSELHRRIGEDRSGPLADADFLLRRLRSRPDLFRVLDPRRGPWRRLGRTGPDPVPEPYRRVLGEAAAPMERWIVPRAGDPEAGSGPGPAAGEGVPRLRASLLRLSRNVDGGSSTALCRWLRLVREDRLLRDRVPGA